MTSVTAHEWNMTSVDREGLTSGHFVALTLFALSEVTSITD
jgi:hypothetical protein